MSASKGKKKSKSKKLRVESTDNVLNEKELEEKKKKKENEETANGKDISSLNDTSKINENEEKVVELESCTSEYEHTTIQEVVTESVIENEKNYKDKNTTKEIIKSIEELEDINQDDKTKAVPTVTKELIKVDEKLNKPEYVRTILAKNKRKMVAFASIVSIVLIAILFSTMFAITDAGNTTILKGVKIKNIDVSKLSSEQSIERIQAAISKELIPEIKLKYNDYEVIFNAKQIEFTYKIEDAVEKAYDLGKSGNIIKDNYVILFSTLFGKNINLEYSFNEELLNSFVNEVNKNLPGVVVEPNYYIEEDNLIIKSGKDGLLINAEDLKAEIINKLISRTASELKDDSYYQIIDLKADRVKAQKIDIAKIYSEIHTEPKDAYYELEPYKVYPDIDGVDLIISVQEAQKEIDLEEKEEYEFKLNITKAQKTISDLGMEAFPYLISEFSTKYDASNINRSTNLKIAADKINGKVLMPGEEFSYNKVVGERTIEEGYKDAKIFANGGVVDGLAGGICQISSTLYNAALLANLEITERFNHTYITSYLPAGKDATVVWGVKDLKFVNSRNYPIKIESSVKNGIAEFKIHGMPEETEYEIKIVPERTASIPYSIVYEEDPTLAPGQTVTKQAGYAGCKVSTYKEIRLNGNMISRELITTDTYSPMKQIIKTGPTM